jgi:hypothetical protein
VKGGIEIWIWPMIFVWNFEEMQEKMWYEMQVCVEIIKHVFHVVAFLFFVFHLFRQTHLWVGPLGHTLIFMDPLNFKQIIGTLK